MWFYMACNEYCTMEKAIFFDRNFRNLRLILWLKMIGQKIISRTYFVTNPSQILTDDCDRLIVGQNNFRRKLWPKNSVRKSLQPTFWSKKSVTNAYCYRIETAWNRSDNWNFGHKMSRVVAGQIFVTEFSDRSRQSWYFRPIQSEFSVTTMYTIRKKIY